MDGMKPDLTVLYSELGLRPNCSLAELQLAYRRRIAELHSDRTAGSESSPERLAMLRDLISLYATANRFHRRYGRLPGAAPQRGGLVGARVPMARSSGAFDSRPQTDPASRPAGLGVALGLLVLLFLLLAAASGEWMR